MGALIDNADQEEHAGRRKSVVEHLQDRAVHGDARIARSGCHGSRGDAQHHKAHMVDRGICHQPFEIRLAIGTEGAEDNRRSRQESQRAGKILGFDRIQRQDQPQETIRAQLEHHTCQDHRAGRWRFGMRIRKPGMERPDRNLDGKGNHKTPEDHGLYSSDRETKQKALSGRPFGRNDGQVKGPEESTQQLDTQQQAERAAHGVDHEFERGIIPIGTAPLVDQEIHRNKADFPEDEEDQQVEGHEDAQHARLEEQEQHHVGLDTVGHAEGGQNGERREQRGQQDHGQRKPIHAEMKRGIDGRIPGILFLELETRHIRLESKPQDNRKEQTGSGWQQKQTSAEALIRSFGRKSRTTADKAGMNKIRLRRWVLIKSIIYSYPIIPSPGGNKAGLRSTAGQATKQAYTVECARTGSGADLPRPLDKPSGAIAEKSVDNRKIEIITNSRT